MKDLAFMFGLLALFALIYIVTAIKLWLRRAARKRPIDPVMPLDHALAIVLTFDGHSLAMSMEEIKALNRARQVVDESANLLIGREPEKFGGRHG